MPTRNREAAFFEFLGSLPEDPRLFRLFERDNGAYFSVYRDNASVVARDFYHTESVVKMTGPESAQVACVYVSHKMFKTIVRALLVDLNCSVEVWSGSGNTWTVSKRASPGNVAAFRDFVLQGGDDDSMCLMAVAHKHDTSGVVVGAAVVNTACRTIKVYEFIDPGYSLLVSVAAQENARECIMPSGASADSRRMQNALSSHNVVVTQKPAPTFDSGDAAGMLRRLLSAQHHVASSASALAYKPSMDGGAGGAPRLANTLDDLQPLSVATRATVAAVRHLGLMRTAAGRYSLEVKQLKQHMRLGPAVMKALQLLPAAEVQTVRAGKRSRARSLFEVLARCNTAMGQRKLRRWVQQPLATREGIEFRHNMVELLYTNAEAREALCTRHLRKVPDLERLGEQFERSAGGLGDALQIYRCAAGLGALARCLDEVALHARDGDASVDATSDATTCGAGAGSGAAMADGATGASAWRQMQQRFVEPVRSAEKDLLTFQALVEETIDVESMKSHRYLLVKHTYCDELNALHQRVATAEAAIESAAAAIASTVGIKRAKLRLERHNLQFGACCRVPKARQKLLNNKPSIQRLAVQSGGVYFTTSALQTASLEYHSSLSLYRETQADVARQVMDVAFTYAPVIQGLGELLSTLDVLVGFAVMCAEAPRSYCRPVLSPDDDAVVKVEQVRHPCVEMQDGVEFIPNNVTLRQRDGPRALIVTGPNMGGKSTYIRTVALAAVLNQIGCFVPADSAVLPVFDCVLARVGASDNQLGGVSTFMAEMLETSAMLRTATSRSLLIVDELGRGTSTYDGFSIAWAVAESLVLRAQCLTLFATHFHELTGLASSEHIAQAERESGCKHSLVSNCHVTAHTTGESITMLYEVKPGACDNSFGLHVAKLAGMPRELMADAARAVRALEGRQSLASLEVPGHAFAPSTVVVDTGTEAKHGNANASGKRSAADSGMRPPSGGAGTPASGLPSPAGTTADGGGATSAGSSDGSPPRPTKRRRRRQGEAGNEACT